MFKNYCTSSSEDPFCLSKQCRTQWNTAFCGISCGSSLFTKVPVYGFPVHKGLKVSSIYKGSDNKEQNCRGVWLSWGLWESVRVWSGNKVVGITNSKQHNKGLSEENIISKTPKLYRAVQKPKMKRDV